MFTHLHNHSYYSLMDGFNSPLELVQTARQQGQQAIAVTDHGTLSSHRELQQACKVEGVKPILGVEAYFSSTGRFDRRSKAKRSDGTATYNHLIVLAKDQRGLQNLQRLSELAWTEGFYSKPRVDLEILTEYREGLIVLSGCMNSVISKSLEAGTDRESYILHGEHMDKAAEWTQRFVEVFGDDFYMEVQPHNPEQLNKGLTQLARRFGIKTVATVDCHFARPEDRLAEELMLIAGTNPKQAKDTTYESVNHLGFMDRLDALYPDRTMSFKALDLYVMSEEEVKAALYPQLQTGAVLKDCIDNTEEIVEKIGEYEYYEGLDLLPTITIRDDSGKERKVQDAYVELERLARKGLRKLGLENAQYQARLAEELEVIKDKDFARYFLIVADVIHWAEAQGILVGPGRGSAAGSLLCYCLGITDVDPIEEQLLFFRFINPERNDFPDIDVDFEDARRGEIKEYLRNKYGYAAAISTFGYFKDKGVIKDVARVLAVPYKEANDVTSKFEFFEEYETRAKHGKRTGVVEDEDGNRVEQVGDPIADFHAKYPLVLEYASKLRGKIRNVGMHAAGMVVSAEPINKYAPIESRKDPSDLVDERVPVLAMDKDQAEALGLIKLDILGLKALTVISSTLKFIERERGITVDLKTVSREDPRVLAEFGKGNTMGVFQAEATPYTKLLMDMGVDSFADLVASTALVRPGAMNTVGVDYLARKRGEQEVRYAHPDLKQYLVDTYGVIIYQEQVMQTAVELGGMKMTTADKLRKIIGKKLDASEFMPYFNEFMEGASKKVDPKVAEKIWHDFEAHAGYSFNKSHAVAYSKLTYWTMWLKVYYPLEYMAALLKHETEKTSKTNYLIEAKRLGITVNLPHVNESMLETDVVGESLLLGLTDIKFISGKIGGKLLEARPFKNYGDLKTFVGTKGSGVNSRVLDALGKVGAAKFEDNPLTGKEREYYYEYLNIPALGGADLGEAERLLTKSTEYEEGSTAFMRGIVTNIKRGKGWTRVEFLDESGSFSAFHDEQTGMEKGVQYVVLLGGNRVCEYLTPEQLDDHSIPLVKWIHATSLPGQVCLSFAERKTKAGKSMGTVVLSNEHKRLVSALVFPGMFASLKAKLIPGKRCDVWLGTTDDGTYFVKGTN